MFIGLSKMINYDSYNLPQNFLINKKSTLIKIKNYVDLGNCYNSLYFGKQKSSLRLLFSLDCIPNKVHGI